MISRSLPCTKNDGTSKEGVRRHDCESPPERYDLRSVDTLAQSTKTDHGGHARFWTSLTSQARGLRNHRPGAPGMASLEVVPSDQVFFILLSQTESVWQVETKLRQRSACNHGSQANGLMANSGGGRESNYNILPPLRTRRRSRARRRVIHTSRSPITDQTERDLTATWDREATPPWTEPKTAPRLRAAGPRTSAGANEPYALGTRIAGSQTMVVSDVRHGAPRPIAELSEERGM